MENEDRSRGSGFAKDIKPSEACGGTVSRTATATGLARDRAEEDALKAARDAAQRACKDKKCGNGSCKYVETGNTGSSAPLEPPTATATFTATMTTTGSCACE